MIGIKDEVYIQNNHQKYLLWDQEKQINKIKGCKFKN